MLALPNRVNRTIYDDLATVRVTLQRALSALRNDGFHDAVTTINVRDRRFYRDVVLGGGLGAAASYLRGYWDSPDLTLAMRVLAQNAEILAGVETTMMLSRPMARMIGGLIWRLPRPSTNPCAPIGLRIRRRSG